MTKITRRKALYTGLAAGAAIATTRGVSAFPLGESSNAKVQIIGGQTPGVLYRVICTFSDYARYADTRTCRGRINTYPGWTRTVTTYGPIRDINQQGLDYILVGSKSDGVTEQTLRLNNSDRIAHCFTKKMELLRLDITPYS